MSNRSNQFSGLLYSLVGTFLVSTNYVTAKYGLRGFDPVSFSLVWTTAASLYSVFILIATGKHHQLVPPLHAIKEVICIGLLTGVGFILGWAGLAQLDPLFAAFLWRFAPVLTLLFGAFFLGERLSFMELPPVALMVLGGVLTSIGQWEVVASGTILTLLACCAVALQMVVAKRAVRTVHPNALVFYRTMSAAVVIAVWAVLRGEADFNVGVSYWLVTLLGALLGPCVSFLFTFRAYLSWDLSRSTIVGSLQPLFVLPMAYLFFAHLPGKQELFGGILILGGAIWLAWHLGRGLLSER